MLQCTYLCLHPFVVVAEASFIHSFIGTNFIFHIMSIFYVWNNCQSVLIAIQDNLYTYGLLWFTFGYKAVLLMLSVSILQELQLTKIHILVFLFYGCLTASGTQCVFIGCNFIMKKKEYFFHPSNSSYISYEREFHSFFLLIFTLLMDIHAIMRCWCNNIAILMEKGESFN